GLGFSLREPRTTFSKKIQPARTSLVMSGALFCLKVVGLGLAENSAAFSIESAQISMIDQPRIGFLFSGLELGVLNFAASVSSPSVTARISGLSRRPSHASQGHGLRKAFRRLFVNSLSLS